MPQFANLVRLEKMSEPGTGDEHCHEEMILGDPADEARSEEIQFVTTTSPPDPDQVLRRLSTTDSLLHEHETTLDTHDPQVSKNGCHKCVCQVYIENLSNLNTNFYGCHCIYKLFKCTIPCK